VKSAAKFMMSCCLDIEHHTTNKNLVNVFYKFNMLSCCCELAGKLFEIKFNCGRAENKYTTDEVSVFVSFYDPSTQIFIVFQQIDDDDPENFVHSFSP
jgi:hypothetical protein